MNDLKATAHSFAIFPIFTFMDIVPPIKLSESLCLSRMIHGHWRLAEWGFSTSELHSFICQLIEWGITSFDHADIYGNHTCERMFGDALIIEKGIRDKIQIITKCGIKLSNGKFPERKIKIYDYSYEHIVASAEQSLRNFHTDHLDLLLFHRPAPFFDPDEVARAMDHLKREGKVLHFGVSNFNPLQFEMLQKHTEIGLLTNQVEISPYCLEHFENGNMDFFIREGIKPMAWSPLAGGRIFKVADDKGKRLSDVFKAIAAELNVYEINKVIYAWLLKHPANIIPIIGSGRIERIKLAVESLDIDMSLEQWYRIYIASRGEELA